MFTPKRPEGIFKGSLRVGHVQETVLGTIRNSTHRTLKMYAILFEAKTGQLEDRFKILIDFEIYNRIIRKMKNFAYEIPPTLIGRDDFSFASMPPRGD